jgi:uncharacterized membrane protein YcaP (DUF421 family)
LVIAKLVRPQFAKRADGRRQLHCRLNLGDHQPGGNMAAKIWSDMFVLGLPMLEKILRPIIIYIVLIIGLRLAGKRELAQLNPFDLVVLLTLSNTVQNAIIGDDTSVTGGIVGAATLLLINYLVVRFLYEHKEIDQLVEGNADVLIENGQVKMDRLEEEVITLAELEVAARRQGFASLAEVESAVLEPGGAITFSGKKPAPEAARHQELVARLDQITRELAALRTDRSAQASG